MQNHKTMQHILILDTNNSRRTALARLFKGMPVETVCVDNFPTGQQWLRHTAQPKMDALVFSWPATTQESADELLAWLSEPAQQELPVIVVAEETQAAALGWVSGRSRSAFLLWDDREQIPETFNILLQAAPRPEPLPDQLATSRILLVDDSPTARVKFRRLLEEAGHYTKTVSSPAEALALLETASFDIAIIDYFMPEMTGAELCRNLLADPAGRHMQCAILTSSYSEKVIQDGLAAGAIDCMFKNEADALFLTRIAAMARSNGMRRHVEQKQQHLQHILTSVGDGVYGVDRAGYITYVNPAVSRILGYKESQLLAGLRPTDLFHAQTPHDANAIATAQYLAEAIASGTIVDNLETTFLRADGTSIQVDLTVQPLEIDNQCEGAVIAFRDISERKLLEDELKWQANHDALTKLYNRKYLEDALEHEIYRLRRSRETSALLYLDLDRFKYINDTIGHIAGDQLLIELADELRKRASRSALLARLGGDEFVLLVYNISEEQLFNVAEEYRKLLENFTFTYEGRSYNIQGSIGVAPIDNQSKEAREILSAADLACHIAKGKGRNMTHIYDNEDRKTAMDMELGWTRRLRHALDHDRFELVYQPMVFLADLDLDEAPRDAADFQVWLSELPSTPEIIFETLLRLQDNRGRLISPNAFIPTAERFNMMADIDSWVLDTALAQLAEVHHAGEAIQMSINLSGQCVDRCDMIEHLQARLTELQLPPHLLLLEVTESCAIRNLTSARTCINAVRDLGCRFALDDFGTGYSTMSQLKHLPVDFIKIDGQFVRDIETDPADMAIVRSIVQIAHASGKLTVAEFVESAEALRLIKECGVDYAQGFFLSPPHAILPQSRARLHSA